PENNELAFGLADRKLEASNFGNREKPKSRRMFPKGGPDSKGWLKKNRFETASIRKLRIFVVDEFRMGVRKE
ncbi:MAG: hypothetical protein M3Y08_19030, partial [Fibrobacterota bacterium]|nr:hypothetical protein [Fibrobacterota bacterium]